MIQAEQHHSAGQGYSAALSGMARTRRLLATTSALVPSRLLLLALASSGLAAGAARAQDALTLPTGGATVGGAAVINTPEAGRLVIDQSSAKAVIDWQGFDVGEEASVRFNQPDNQSITVNRVTAGGASRIDGQVSARGKVVILNPNGVLIGPGGRIDAAGVVASTARLDAEAFMAGNGNLTFTPGGNAGAEVVNEGAITVEGAGIAALVGPTVRNTGTIKAVAGKVNLAAGETFTLDLAGDGLVELAVTGAGRKLEQAGVVEGSTVVMSADAAADVVSSVINVSGVTRATAVSLDGGDIVLDGGRGGVLVTGTLDASSSGGAGGTVVVTGHEVTIGGTARVKADGGTAGGKVLIGGDRRGGTAVAEKLLPKPVPTAAQTAVEAGARVSATGGSGQGGAIVVWGDARASVSGLLSAGGQGGGFIETSGLEVLLDGAAIDAGAGGRWLLDPTNYTLDSAAATTIQTSLNAGTNVLIETAATGSDAGDITVGAAVTWTTGATLELAAHRNITVNAALTASGGGDLTLRADKTGSGIGGVTVTVNPTLSAGSLYNIYYNPADTNSNGKRYDNPLTYGATGGTVTAWMLVNTLADLQAMGDNLAGNYALSRDIDASATASWNSGAGFVPVGNNTNRFTGRLDGQGHVVDSLHIYRPDVALTGLIGFASGATISNIGLISADVTGGSQSGALAGRIVSGAIGNAFATGRMDGGSGSSVGGLVGQLDLVTLSDAWADVETRSSGGAVGGLVGNNQGSIVRSHAAGSVSGGATVGGLVGQAGIYSGGTISESYATGAVTGTSKVGGLIGAFSFDLTLTNVYASGAVTGTSATGGLIGGPGASSTVTGSNAYWDAATTGQSQGIGDATGAGGLSVSAIGAAPYAAASYAGFDFTNTWYIAEGSTRPILRSEYSTTIRNANQLQLMALNLGAAYVLANDIDFGSAYAATGSIWNPATGFVPVGNNTNRFTGTLDGQGHVVDGLFINRTVIYTGMISVSTGTIRNLGLTQANITGGSSTGALVGMNGGTVTGVFATGSVTVASGDYVGGLVGESFGSLTDSWASVTVSAENSFTVGGLAGRSSGLIARVHAGGAVTGRYAVGGLLGYIYKGSIDDSYATGAVTAALGTVGGLAGQTINNFTLSITNSYATGAVTGPSGVGGLVGAITRGTGINPTIFLTDTYWDATTTGVAVAYGELTSAATIDATNIAALPYAAASYAGFDFTNTWYIAAGSTRPILRSEYSTTIHSAHQVQLMALGLGASYRLGQDINLGTVLSKGSEVWNTATGFVPVGSVATPFTGRLDGQGHAIAGLTITRSTTDNAGLFGVAQGGNFSNLGLTGINVTGKDYVGGLVGQLLTAGSTVIFDTVEVQGRVSGANQVGGLFGGSSNVSITILDSTLDLTATATGSDVGGAFGKFDRSLAPLLTIDGLTADVTVSGVSRVGGLGGYLNGALSSAASVANIGITANVTASGSQVGGLFGLANAAAISEALVDARVSGPAYAGGAIGQADGVSLNGVIARADVSGGNNIGGLIGRYVLSSGAGVIDDVSVTGTISGAQSLVGGLLGYAGVGGAGPTLTVTRAYAGVNISGTTITSGGGLIGLTDSLSTVAISDSYSTGSLTAANAVNTGTYAIGALIGQNFGTLTLDRVYASGKLTAPGTAVVAGGLVGRNTGTLTATNGYWDVGTTGQTVTAGNAGTGIASADAFAAATYTGFDFSNTWYIAEGDTRPILRGEYSTTILNPHQVQLIALDLGASYRLGRDIDLGATRSNASEVWNIATGFLPVGTTAVPFLGDLDGGGHAIDGLYIKRSTLDNVGLFGAIGGFVADNGAVSNLALTAFDVSGRQSVGGLAGTVSGSSSATHSFTGITLSGTVTATAGGAGGLFGRGFGGNIAISGLAGDVTVSAASGAGGAIGLLAAPTQQVTIAGVELTGSIHADTESAGGLLGSSSNGQTSLLSIDGVVLDVLVTGGGNLGGLGGQVDKATVSNIRITSTVTGNASGLAIGGLLGLGSGTFSAIDAKVDVTGGQSVGGLFGANTSGNLTLTASSVTGAVKALGALGNAGGIIGESSTGLTVSKVFAGVAVQAVGGSVGGLAGFVQFGSITDSYATGSVTSGGDQVGGLIGYALNITLANVYASGAVHSTLAGAATGGLLGFTGLAPTITNGYWDVGTTGRATSAGGGTGFATANAFTAATYAGFDFTNTWYIAPGDTRPILRSEYSTTIRNAHQLQLMASSLAANYVLADDIDLASALADPGGIWNTAKGFSPVGNLSTRFTGTFDGQGHAIRGLYINRPSGIGVGLFGAVAGAGSRIANLILLDVDVRGGDSVGGVIGQMNSGVVSDLVVTGKASAVDFVGLVVGDGIGGTLQRVSAEGQVSGSSSATGGVIGGTSTITVSDVYAGVNVSGSIEVGGLIGRMDGAIVTRAYATGTVTGASSTGGLVGSAVSGSLSQTYASGLVTGSAASVGGLVGALGSATAASSYFDVTTTGKAASALGTAIGTASAAFTANTYAGFDLAGGWYMDPDAAASAEGRLRPILRAEYSTSIWTSHQLQLMAMGLGASYTLRRDLDLAPALANQAQVWRVASGFMPVKAGINAFSGQFDGAGYTINGLGINGGSANNIGLFGQISGATIRDLTLANVAISGTGTYYGALAGGPGVAASTISGVHVSGTVSAGSYAGGIVGSLNGTISGVSSSAAVNVTVTAAGGLLGELTGSLRQSYATGDVVAAGDLAGGLVAVLQSNAAIAQSYFTGTVKAANYAGGLVGIANFNATITDSYAMGAVAVGSNYAGGLAGRLNGGQINTSYAVNYVLGSFSGGLVGLNSSGTVGNLFWVSLVAGKSNASGSGSLNGSASARTIAQLQAGLPTGFSATIWGTIAGTAYPYLQWRFPTGPSVLTGNGGVGRGVAVLADGKEIGRAIAGSVGDFYVAIDPLAPGGMAIAGWDGRLFNASGLTTGTGLATGIVDLATVAGSSAGHALNFTLGTNTLTILSARTSLSSVISGIDAAAGATPTGSYLFSTAGGDLAGTTHTTINFNNTASAFTLDRSMSTAGSGTILLRLTTADSTLTLNSGETLGAATTSGTGVAVSAPKLVNNAGTSVFSLAGAARYLVYADDWETSNLGGLGGADRNIYNATVQSLVPSAVSGAASKIIWKRAATLTVTVADGSRTYGSAFAGGSASITGLVNGDTNAAYSGFVLVTDTSALAAGAGSYAGVLKGNGLLSSAGYTIVYQAGTLTIDKAVLTASLTGTVSKTYDGSNGATLTAANYTLSTPLFSDQVTLQPALAGTYATANVGSGLTVTVAGLTLGGTAAGNYRLSATTLQAPIGTITAKALNASLTGTASKIYDGTTDLALTAANYHLGGVVGSDAVTLVPDLTGELTAADVGSGLTVNVSGLSLTGANAANYTLAPTLSGSIGTVTARPITITAAAKSRSYGDVNPVLTYALTAGSLVGSDSLTGSLSTSATTASSVGTYAITQGTLAASSNYALTYVGANLTVTKRALTVTADALSRAYGDANPALIYTVTAGSLVGSDSLTGGLSTVATTTSSVGT